MNKARSPHAHCATGHALAIVRWEDNRKGLRDGDFFGLTSKRTYLQDLVGNGRTLWIIVSRGRQPRMYSLSFRLEKCRNHHYKDTGRFGRHAVIGDPESSTLFASNDARLLLLRLRFDPFSPINNE